MADQTLLNKIHDLSDLELATLICLVAQEHCIIDTDQDSIDELVQELELVCTCYDWPYNLLTDQIAEKVFGLSYATLDLSEHTSLDEFAHAILSVEDSATRSDSPARVRRDSLLHAPAHQPTSRSPLSPSFSDNIPIPHVIIAKNLDRASRQIQIQALELMRTKRIYTRTSMHSAPKRFLFIAVLADASGPGLTKHLNEYMFISHFHNPDDGFPNLEDAYDDQASISSVVKKSLVTQSEPELPPRISAAVCSSSDNSMKPY
jgi:hypothetical protein